ncbi:MAG: C25 family cysteine peptidase [Bacteroidota bacterium]
MKKLILLVSILFINLGLFGQSLGNEWIQNNQAYYKIKISEEGVYKIDSTTLAQLGINLNGLHPKRFQLFKNGIEQYCFIPNEGDGAFNTGDYILFYAGKNDGKLDAELYRTAKEQPHQFNSLFTDTAVYFLTILPVSSPIQTKRFSTFNESNYAAYTPESYFIKKTTIAPLDEYYRGTFYSVDREAYYLSEYVDGESWMGSKFGLTDSRIYWLNTPNISNVGPSPVLESKVFGVSNAATSGNNHHLQIGVAANGGGFTTIKDTTYLGYIETSYFIPLSASNIGSATTQFKFETLADLGITSDFSALSYLTLSYASNFTLSGTSTLNFSHIAQQSSSRIYFQFANYTKSSPNILDLTSNRKITCSLTGTDLKALAENFNQEQKFFVYDDTDIKNISSLEPVDMNYVSSTLNYNFIIISNKKLSAAAANYKNYRAQSYNTLLTFSEDLYNQFSYGYEHPLAVKHFLKYLYTNQSQKPEYLLLLGRGYQNNLVRNNFQDAYNKNLVPAIGEPASDNMFTFGLDVSKPYAPGIATGRIPAATNQEVQNYLDKLIYYETNPDSLADWRKQVLHLSGGSESEQITYTNQINGNKSQISTTFFGGNVTSFNKTSSEPVETGIREILIGELNKGKGLMTFLGHGSLTVLDVDFGGINNIQNQNKYTFFYFNGCNIGNASDADPNGTGNIYGKDFLVANNKGAIGWLAHSNLTLTGSLFSQMNTMYGNLSKNMYGKSIGQIIAQSLSETTTSGGVFEISHSYQLVYQGDPALRLASPTLPDYAITQQNIFLSNKDINAQVDSFQLNAIIKNMGKAIDDTLLVTVEHYLPNNNLITYDSISLIAPYYMDTLSLNLKSFGSSMVGNNTFKVIVDKRNSKTEANKQNNSESTTVFIPGSGLNILSPLNYALHNSDSVELIAQNNDLLAKDKEYIFEIDSSLNFNTSSTFYQTSGIIKFNDLAKWKIKLAANDSIVYYWRARFNLPANQGGAWVSASFTKIQNSTFGFRQSAFDQYSNTSFNEETMFNSVKKRLEFADNELNLGMQNKRFDHRNMGVIIPYQLNAGVGSCISQGTVALVFEPYQAEIPYELPNYPFNCAFVQSNKTNRSYRYYPFDTRTVGGREEFRTFIDSIPSGYYVAIFSRYDSGIDHWDTATLNSLSKIGATKISQIKSKNTAWAIISMKDAPINFAAEDTVNNDSLGALVDQGMVSLPPAANQPQDTRFIKIIKPLVTKWYRGSIVSKPFGPVNSWSKLLYSFDETDVSPNSKYHIDIIGVNKQGADTLIYTNITSSNVDLSLIDAKLIPYLKLKIDMEDSTKRTPQQFGYWQIEATPAAEAKLSPNLVFTVKNNPIEEGDSLLVEIGIENIGKITFDTANLNIKIVDESRVTKYQSNDTILPLAINSNYTFSKKLPTLGLSQNNQVQFTLNNEKTVQELTYINNYISTNLTVTNDNSNPYISVTFDGVKIMSGDIVSPQPTIQITSTDNNKFILQNDTSKFSLWIKKQSNFDFEKIYINNSDVQFIPASDKNNKATLIYKPKNLADDTYTLKVQTADAVGNKSGSNDYEVNFKVINKSTITNFFPYPNPGTTNIRFIFTLTGSKTPDDLLIRIMTITGKVVKEITRQEFGAIKIGNNISEYAWDGNDMYGDRLANGVYLYQVITRINERSIETSKSNATDKYFTEGVGKIYLMR